MLSSPPSPPLQSNSSGYDESLFIVHEGFTKSLIISRGLILFKRKAPKQKTLVTNSSFSDVSLLPRMFAHLISRKNMSPMTIFLHLVQICS